VPILRLFPGEGWEAENLRADSTSHNLWKGLVVSTTTAATHMAAASTTAKASTTTHAATASTTAEATTTSTAAVTTTA
jgi:hypothetical protein